MGQSSSCMDGEIEAWLGRQQHGARLLALPLNNGTIEERSKKQKLGPLRRKLNRRFGFETDNIPYDCIRKPVVGPDHTPFYYQVTPSAQSRDSFTEDTPAHDSVSRRIYRSESFLRSLDKACGPLYKDINYAVVNMSQLSCDPKELDDMLLKTPVKSDIPFRRMPSRMYYDSIGTFPRQGQNDHQYKGLGLINSPTTSSDQSVNHLVKVSHHGETSIPQNNGITSGQCAPLPGTPARSQQNLTLPNAGHRTVICTDCGECLPERTLSKYTFPRRTSPPQKQLHLGPIASTQETKSLGIQQTRLSTPRHITHDFPDKLPNTSTPKKSALVRSNSRTCTGGSPSKAVHFSPSSEAFAINEDTPLRKSHDITNRHSALARNLFPDMIKIPPPPASHLGLPSVDVESLRSHYSTNGQTSICSKFNSDKPVHNEESSQLSNSKNYCEIQIKNNDNSDTHVPNNLNKSTSNDVSCSYSEELINAFSQKDLNLVGPRSRSGFVERTQQPANCEISSMKTTREGTSDGRTTENLEKSAKEINNNLLVLEVESAIEEKHKATYNDHIQLANNFQVRKDSDEEEPWVFRDPGILPENSLLRHHLSSCIESLELTDITSVQRWLQDIRVLTETECLSTLQSKCLTSDPELLAALAVCNALDTIATLKDRSAIITGDFAYILKKADRNQWEKFSPSACQLSADLRDLHHDYNISLPNMEPDLLKACNQLQEACNQLESHSNSDFEKDEKDLKKEIFGCLKNIGECFQRLTDRLYLQQLVVIVEGVEESKNSFCVKRSIAAINSLGQTGEHMCELIAKAGGIRALLALCVERKWRHLQATILRALTIVCSVPSAVQQLEEASGMDIITDILCEDSSSIQLRSEAAGLVAQITAPWMDSSGATLRGLAENTEKLVHSLTDLASSAKTSEVFLLATAALANLSFLDTSTCDWLRKYHSARVLVSACRHGDVCDSVFVKDQVATVMANMAASSNSREEVVNSGAVVLLLCFLQARSSKFHSQAEIAACERVQQKSAIALSRLCTDNETSAKVIQMQGVQRLVRLCKDEKERNHSDSVLVACLAALKKIATACGTEEFVKLEATELVKEKLWDSFQKYSSKHESFV
ncbi:uncharacterized protein LOC106457037 isoform X2 [Limulus polyphemus]|uniref:Uncharacterized protein LOC106457037 isoform X2 n=1 Tax=Limulus polyphemus TaxID=6850 RepID=A0ABM1AZS5_LIMPO|nr:uncharacterized protein LOC106457037 isoform X2 [Limulus polyphemus]